MEDKSVYIKKVNAGHNRKPKCIHHWIIQPSLDITTAGECKLCGESRIFLNFVENNQDKKNTGRFFDMKKIPDEG